MSHPILLGPIDPMGGAIVVPPPVQGDPDGLRRAAHQLERAAATIDVLSVTPRTTVSELASSGGWTGPAADAFRDALVEPACAALAGVARELDQVAIALRGAAHAIEEARAQRRHAEELAIGAGVGVAATLLTFGLSDVVGADAAVTASALMVRAAATAASAARAVAEAMAAAEEAITALSTRLATAGPALLAALSANLPRLMQSPAFAGAESALQTAAIGDTRPEDLVQALAIGYAEGRLGGGAEAVEESPGPGRRAPAGGGGTFARFLSKPPPTTGEELWLEISTVEGVLVGTRRKGSREHVHELPDDLAHAEAYYARLRRGGVDATPSHFGPGSGITKLRDGTYITFRARSTSGPPTLDINIPCRGPVKLKFKG